MKKILGPVALVVLALAFAVFWPRTPDNPGQVEPVPDSLQQVTPPPASEQSGDSLPALPVSVEQVSPAVADAPGLQLESPDTASIERDALKPEIELSTSIPDDGNIPPPVEAVRVERDADFSSAAARGRGTPPPAVVESISPALIASEEGDAQDPYGIVSPEEAHMQTLVPAPPKRKTVTIAPPGTLHIGRGSPAWQSFAQQEEELERERAMANPDRPAMP